MRVPCSTSSPVSLVIDGYFILRSTVNIDLPVAGKPTGGADNWYLFAVRTPGSKIFSLDVNTSPVESSGRRLIGSFYWTGTAIAAPSIRTSLANSINLLTNHLQFTGCQGRLSMDTSSPVKDAEGATVTLHPYKGNSDFFVYAWLGLEQLPHRTGRHKARLFTDGVNRQGL